MSTKLVANFVIYLCGLKLVTPKSYVLLTMQRNLECTHLNCQDPTFLPLAPVAVAPARVPHVLHAPPVPVHALPGPHLHHQLWDTEEKLL